MNNNQYVCGCNRDACLLHKTAPELLEAAKRAYDMIGVLSKQAGDVDFWNEWGLGYEANQALYRAITKAEQK